jgi:ATP-dependent exoDNAse (exonuclease V) beta subunit
MKLLKFNQDFIVEKLLKDTKYPLSKIQFKRCNEIIKINDLNNEKDKNKFIEKLDLLVKNGNHIVICDWKTNKEIKKHSGFDTRAKTNVKMKYPLNTLEDCNFYHYTLQLSTYAWMVQKLNPEFVIDDLILVHFDHQGNQTIYHLDYLKKEVEMMLAYYKKMRIHELQEEKYKEIEY